MRYLSICSGIEAASLAWEPMGWQPVAFAEIDRFASEILAARYGSNMPGDALSQNGVPNLGDITQFQTWPEFGAVDLVVGGTPCQSFSVAGLRGGIADPRGNLALTYLGIVDRYRPRWTLWENVPGVLSSWSPVEPQGDLRIGERREVDEVSDFGCFVAGLQQLGYCCAWRVLDAQFVRVDGYDGAVPQRRQRVFVVGHSGADWRRPAAVLFDGASLRGGSPPRREARKGLASLVGGGPDGGRVAGTVSSKWAKGTGGPSGAHAPAVAFQWQADGKQTALGYIEGSGTSPALTRNMTPAVAFDLRGREAGAQFEGPHDTANIRASSGGSSRSYVAAPWAVRRLTPLECERLQGMPDGWTAIGRAGRPAADGPRYRAIGNSMAVNVMRWLGRRIEMVESATAGE